MTVATFLYEDSSWMPVPIQWGPGFNAHLRNALENPSAATVTPIAIPNLDSYQAGNSNALRLLDSRQIDSNGKLPTHVCAAAHGVWEEAEKEMLTLNNQLNTSPQPTPEFELLDAYVSAWILLVRINLGNLSLIDVASSSHRRSTGHDYIQSMRAKLDEVRRFEASLEAALKGPVSPTRLLRNTVDFVYK